MSILGALEGVSRQAVSWPWERGFAARNAGEAEDFANWLWTISATGDADFDRSEITARQLEVLYHEFCAIESREPVALGSLRRSIGRCGIVAFRPWRIVNGKRTRVTAYRLDAKKRRAQIKVAA